MTPLPKPPQPTVDAIYAAYAASREPYDSFGISVGELGNECDRSLYYTLHWASPLEQVDGRKVRIFRRGDLEEARLIEDLEAIGAEVFGQQDRIRLVAGHVRGKIDARILGIPEAPKTEHLAEFKSAKTESFRNLVKNGVTLAEPKHYVQCQIGMHAFGLTRALYVCCDKNDETLYSERIKYDLEFCVRLLARAERIIRADSPPAKIANKADDFRCMFCKHKSICHQVDGEGEPAVVFARVTCRSCLYSTAEMDGDAHWSCGRHSTPLSFDDQKAACPAHLYIPGMFPGEQVDSDQEAELVTYKMADGTLYVDGAPSAA